MNGSFAPIDEEIEDNEELEAKLTDYSIAIDAIYVSFNWSLSDEGYKTVRKLAIKYDVGFFDVSGTEHIILPDGSFID